MQIERNVKVFFFFWMNQRLDKSAMSSLDLICMGSFYKCHDYCDCTNKIWLSGCASTAIIIFILS